MRLVILSWCVGLLVSGLITLTYAPHNSFSMLLALPLIIPAGMLYPGEDDWLFYALMILFGSLVYGFVILVFAKFIKEFVRRTHAGQ